MSPAFYRAGRGPPPHPLREAPPRPRRRTSRGPARRPEAPPPRHLGSALTCRRRLAESRQSVSLLVRSSQPIGPPHLRAGLRPARRTHGEGFALPLPRWLGHPLHRIPRPGSRAGAPDLGFPGAVAADRRACGRDASASGPALRRSRRSTLRAPAGRDRRCLAGPGAALAGRAGVPRQPQRQGAAGPQPGPQPANVLRARGPARGEPHGRGRADAARAGPCGRGPRPGAGCGGAGRGGERGRAGGDPPARTGRVVREPAGGPGAGLHARPAAGGRGRAAPGAGAGFGRGAARGGRRAARERDGEGAALRRAGGARRAWRARAGTAGAAGACAHRDRDRRSDG